MKIKAGILTGPFEAQIGWVETETPGPTDVVIRTEFSFVSNGTESHVHRQAFPTPPYPFPRVIGYQAAGRVEQVGAEVSGIALRDRVFVVFNKVTGITNALGGVHSEWIVAPISSVWRVPDGVEALAASAAVVAQVGYNGASRLPDRTDGTVVVIGDGVIGQFAAQAALARGWRVLMSGHHARRLVLGRAAAPTLLTTDGPGPGLREEARRQLGRDPDAVIDSVGSPDSLALAQGLLPAQGHLVVLGYWAGTQVLDVHAGFATEATVHFPAGFNRDRITATLALMQKGGLTPQPLVTHIMEASDFPKACRLLQQPGADYLGIAIDWR